MPACGNNCLIITEPVGNLPPRPVLIRIVNRLCPICRTDDLSEYGHMACYSCAERNFHPLEFLYHNRRCFVNPYATIPLLDACEVENAPNPNSN